MAYSRNDYEHQELDNDGFYYWFRNNSVKWVDKDAPQEIRDFITWFYEEELKYKDKSLYYKGTALYFTYKDSKYFVSWTFYGLKLLKDAKKRLNELGCSNIQVNLGELD